MENIMTFLKRLAKNNNREWFEKNKPKYIEAKEEFEVFVSSLLEHLVLIDETLEGLDPKKSIFRIYRDVRFSKDKRPYKTNFGASFSSAGKGVGTPGYYFQFEPGNNTFVAGGLYMPDAAALAKVRQEIDYNATNLMGILKDKKFKSTFAGFWDQDKLKTAPKGYPKDHAHIELLKLKSFIVTHNFSDKEVNDRKFSAKVVSAFKTVKPLNDFLREAVS